MSDTVEIPAEIPRKRRQVEKALDVWIASWLARDDLAPSDRRRLEVERDRRKRLRKTEQVVVGFVGTPEGMTPEQRDKVGDLLDELAPTKVLHEYSTRGSIRRFHGMCVARKLEVELLPERDVIKEANVVLVTTKDSREPPRRMDADEGVWGPIRYCRHRGVPVKVILPDGVIYNQEG